VLIDFLEGPLGVEIKERKIGPFHPRPVRIQIGNADLHGYPKESDDEPPEFRWYPLSLLEVAKWGLMSLMIARETGQYVYELGRHGDSGQALLFMMSGDDILIHSTMTEVTVRLPFQMVWAAWQDFAERVRQFMLVRYPELQREPGWTEWLRGQDNVATWQAGWGARPGVELFPFWQKWFDEHESAFNQIDAVET
jgi:hypothetical protein